MTDSQELRRLREFIDKASDGFVFVDEEGRVVEWNRAHERITGLAREQALGMYLWDLLASHMPPERRRPELVAAMKSQLQHALRTGELSLPIPFEVRFVRQDGETGVLQQSVFVYQTEQGFRIGSVVRDVTERERAAEERARLQAQLAQAQKMESVGRLAGGIAHDFNNLLTSIVGHASLGLLDLAPGAQLYPALVEILRTAESAAHLTQQLLAFSRRQIIEPRVLDLNQVLDNMQRMLARLLREDIALAFVPAPGLGHVRVDANQVEQLVVNLVLNAHDAMPGGGQLVLATSEVELDATFAVRHAAVPSGRYVRLSVADTGTGLSEEARAHLFEPFFTTKPPGHGTGLGLAMVYGAVQQNGGIIDVQSEPGRGTTFEIYFPVVAAAVEPERRANHPGLPEGRESIVLVEDADGVRAVAVRILERLGYQVRPFASGTEALQTLTGPGAPVDLLITDLVMPGLSGWNLAREAEALLPGLRVLFTSGYAEPAPGRDAAPPAFDFLEKPYSPQTLAHKVREVLDRR